MQLPAPAMHPANLGLRLLLELCAIGALAWWGHAQSDGPLRWVLALTAPLAAASVWGVFAVHGDPSRSGNAVVPVTGIPRLVVELAVFGSAVWALRCLDQDLLAIGFATVVLVHYSLSYRRLLWLLSAG